MTFLDEGETLIAVNFSAVNQISEFIAFATMDKNLFTNALFLVNNITFSSKKVCAFFIKNKLISFFAHTYDSYSLFEEISEFMVKCLVNLLNNCGCRENIEAFKDIFPIIKPKLFLGHSKLLNNLLYLKAILSFKNNNVSNSFLSQKLDRDLMSIYPYEKCDSIVKSVNNEGEIIELFPCYLNDIKSSQSFVENSFNKSEKNVVVKSLNNIAVYSQKEIFDLRKIILRIFTYLIESLDQTGIEVFILHGIITFVNKALQTFSPETIRDVSEIVRVYVNNAAPSQLSKLLINNICHNFALITDTLGNALLNEQNKLNVEHYSTLRLAYFSCIEMFISFLENCVPFYNTLIFSDNLIIPKNIYLSIFICLNSGYKNDDFLYFCIVSLYKFFKVVSGGVDENLMEEKKFIAFRNWLENIGFKETLSKLMTSKDENVSKWSDILYSFIYEKNMDDSDDCEDYNESGGDIKSNKNDKEFMNFLDNYN